jgi:hypothetical protein
MKQDEERMLREYAAGRACTQSVIDALGPMSLWSKAGFDAEIRKAVEAEREACAKLVEGLPPVGEYRQLERATFKDAATAIRARGEA